MPLNFKIEKFEGPLDLLLHLIEEEKLSISEISLSAVADQYLESLKDITERDPDELADFLVVAAKLLLIKSRELLPSAAPIEEEGPSLETQLKMYKIFFEAAQKLEALIKKKRFLFFRDKLPAAITPRFSPPPSVNAERLHQSFIDVLVKITPVIKYPEERLKRTVSIQEKIERIRGIMEKGKTMRFHEIMDGSTDRTEIVVNFLALLELIRSRTVVAEQSEEFGEIVINHKDAVAVTEPVAPEAVEVEESVAAEASSDV